MSGFKEILESLGISKEEFYDLKDWLGSLGLLGEDYEKRVSDMKKLVKPGDKTENFLVANKELLMSTPLVEYFPDMIWNKKFGRFFDDPDLVGNRVDSFSTPKVSRQETMDIDEKFLKGLELFWLMEAGGKT